jgi:hypothetical protein
MGLQPLGRPDTFRTIPKNVILSTPGNHIHARPEDTVRLQPGIWIISICLLFAISAHAQGRNPPPPTAEPSRANGGADEAQQRLAIDMAKKANLQRQAALKADTDKLLKLAVELKDSVDKSSENVLSLDVLKKAEEIEKLAHSVKDKMKGPN